MVEMRTLGTTDNGFAESTREIMKEVDYPTDIQLAENEGVEEEALPSDEYAKKRELLKSTKIVKQTWSILEIYQKLNDGKLQLKTKYQRNVIWDNSKKTAFIESLFMGIIIPPIYVVEIPGTDFLKQNIYEVVDGKQRVSTIESFISSKLRLREKSLEYYRDWYGGKTFLDIREEHGAEVNEMLSSVLDIYVITANSPEFTKYDIFSRLNKGAEKLKVNEIRKAIYRSDFMEYMEEYVEEHVKDTIYTSVFSNNDIKRYEDYGRFFRSVAFYLNSDLDNKRVRKYNSRPRDMINDVLYNIQKGDIQVSSSDVIQIIDMTIALLRLFIDSKSNAHYLVDACIPYAILNRERLLERAEQISQDSVINDTLVKSPSTTTNVNLRLERVIELMNS